MKYMIIKKYNPYITGIVGQDIKLTLWQRIKLLFHKGITVSLIQESFRKNQEVDLAEKLQAVLDREEKRISGKESKDEIQEKTSCD